MSNVRANFASLVSKPTVIDQPGRYVTRGGETVAIIAASDRHEFGCHGSYSCGLPDRWHKSGRLYFTTESKNDIVARAA